MAEPLFTLPPYDEALATLRGRFSQICGNRYSSPCAIGVLLPDEVRERLLATAADTHGGTCDIYSFPWLAMSGVLAAQNEADHEAYCILQATNDSGRRAELRTLIFGEVA